MFLECTEPSDDEEFDITQGRVLPHSYVTMGNSQDILTFKRSINKVDKMNDTQSNPQPPEMEDQEVVGLTEMGNLSCCIPRKKYSPEKETASDIDTMSNSQSSDTVTTPSGQRIDTPTSSQVKPR